MRITRVDVNLYRVPPDRVRVDAIQAMEALELALVEVFSDEGVSGVGFTYTIGKGGRALTTFIQDELVPLALGRTRSTPSASGRSAGGGHTGSAARASLPWV